LIDLAKFLKDALKDVNAPGLKPIIATAVSLAKHLIITISVVTEYRCWIQNPTSCSFLNIKSILDQ
jgi:hypothetical protein